MKNAEKPSILVRITRLKRRYKALISFIAGIPAVILASYGVIKQAIIEIKPSGPTYDPFMIPFIAKNPSNLLSTKDVDVTCVADKIRFQNLQMADVSLTDGPKFDLDSGGSKITYCRLVNASKNMTARIHFEGTYKTLTFNRRIPELILSWDANSSPPRWIKADSNF